MFSSEEIEKLKQKYQLQTTEKRFKLENEWDSTFIMNDILSIKDIDVDTWRMHILLKEYRYVSFYFDDNNKLFCVFKSLKLGLHFKIYDNGKIIRYFSTNAMGRYKNQDKILISDLEDEDAAFALSTIYEDIPLMIRYLDLYKNLIILRNAIYEDIKNISYVELKTKKDIINLENYRCILSI